MWSLDGETWNESSSSGASFTTEGFGVAYGFGADGKSGLWVATGNDSNNFGNLMWSTNGKTWNNSTSTGTSFTNEGINTSYGLSADGKTGIWAATGADLTSGTSAGNLMWSTDGKSWNISSGTSFAEYGKAVAYGLSSDKTGLWVAAGRQGTADNFAALKWSLNGQEWNDSTSTGASFIFGGATGVAYGLSSDNKTGIWVATGQNDGGTSAGNLKWSLNGQEWNDSTATGASFENIGQGVAYGLTSNKSTGIWVAAGKDNDGRGKLLWSSDGQTWNNSTGTTPGTDAIDVAYGMGSDGTTGRWVATAAGDNDYQHLLWSNDGKYWSASTASGASFTDSASGVGSNLTNVAFKGTTQSSYLPKIPDVFPNFNPY